MFSDITTLRYYIGECRYERVLAKLEVETKDVILIPEDKLEQVKMALEQEKESMRGDWKPVPRSSAV